MTSVTSADPKEIMARQLSILREYACKAVLHGNSLAPDEEASRADHMQEFLATGESFGLAEKEMVNLIYRGLLRNRRGCGCHSCCTRTPEWQE